MTDDEDAKLEAAAPTLWPIVKNGMKNMCINHIKNCMIEQSGSVDETKIAEFEALDHRALWVVTSLIYGEPPGPKKDA